MKNAIPSAVYAMRGANGRVKVGRSIRPEQRAATLQAQTGMEITVVYQTEIRDDASYIEAAVHKFLDPKWVVGEWFDIEVPNAIAAIDMAVREIVRSKATWIAPNKDGRLWSTRDTFYRNGNTIPFKLRLPHKMCLLLDSRVKAERSTRSLVVCALLDQELSKILGEERP